MDFGLALRGLWMQEESLLTAKGLSFLQRNRAGLQELTGVLYAKDKQASWAIGPQMGLYSRWLLGYGFEVLGNAVTSLLYSRYTTWSSSLAWPITNQIVADLETTPQGDHEVLKHVLETFLGIRWGSYFKNHRYHGNLSIGYDFNIYWNQNLSSVFPDKSADMGNFYLQGLNVAAGVQF